MTEEIRTLSDREARIAEGLGLSPEQYLAGERVPEAPEHTAEWKARIEAGLRLVMGEAALKLMDGGNDAE